jgi:pre-60S factor REI1
MLGTATATTTATTTSHMDGESCQNVALHSPSLNQSLGEDEDNTSQTLSAHVDEPFEEAQCLFCNHISSELDDNLSHMLKSHGLYIDPAHLLVDTGSLLAYFHLIISGYHECLYCGTQRSTRQAIQQHMMAKGHCKYDITEEDSEMRDFYEVVSSEEKEHQRQNLFLRFSEHTQSTPSKGKSSNTASRPHADLTGVLPDETPCQTPPAEDSSDSTARSAEPSGELSTRIMRQERRLDNQLSQLRAGDQKSLAHLPAAQQRAVLAAHLKQVEKARKTEQAYRGRLETAGNHFNRLGRMRLIKVHPMMGNLYSLNK